MESKRHSKGVHEILQIFDIETGLLILEIGSENLDSYFPCFVFDWHWEKALPSCVDTRPYYMTEKGGIMEKHFIELKKESRTR